MIWNGGGSQNSKTWLDTLLGGNGATYRVVPMPSTEEENKTSYIDDPDASGKDSSKLTKHHHHHHHHYDKETHSKNQTKRNALKVGLIFLLVFIGYHLSDPEKVCSD